jgi:hypothetical protein
MAAPRIALSELEARRQVRSAAAVAAAKDACLIEPVLPEALDQLASHTRMSATPRISIRSSASCVAAFRRGPRRVLKRLEVLARRPARPRRFWRSRRLNWSRAGLLSQPSPARFTRAWGSERQPPAPGRAAARRARQHHLHQSRVARAVGGQRRQSGGTVCRSLVASIRRRTPPRKAAGAGDEGSMNP